jgi:methylphosphotriester-DNA--protein-cysteine methyltransferase
MDRGHHRRSFLQGVLVLSTAPLATACTFHRAFKRWTGLTPVAFRRGGHA